MADQYNKIHCSTKTLKTIFGFFSSKMIQYIGQKKQRRKKHGSENSIAMSRYIFLFDEIQSCY